MPDTTRREFIALSGGGCLLLAVKVKRASGAAAPSVAADRHFDALPEK